MRSRLVDDGYFTTAPAGQLAELVSLPAVRAGMSRIVAAGWPATMILLYDEAWAITLHFASLVGALSGNEMSFDMLAWLVAPARGEAGFAPHRDRQPSDVRASFRGAPWGGRLDDALRPAVLYSAAAGTLARRLPC